VDRPVTSCTPQILQIEEEECWRLIPMASLGRVGLTEGALPVILPVHFTVHEAEVAFASLPDVKIRSADRGDILVFQVDHYDPSTRQGWAVNAIGPARRITQPDEIRHLHSVNFTPWSWRDCVSYVAIRPDVLRGRRLVNRDLGALGPSS
jgi:uncharacterized protein